MLPNKHNGYSRDGLRTCFKGGGKKSKTSAPLPPAAPVAPPEPVVLNQNSETTKRSEDTSAAENKGRKALRIDRTKSSSDSGTGLNIPS